MEAHALCSLGFGGLPEWADSGRIIYGSGNGLVSHQLASGVQVRAFAGSTPRVNPVQAVCSCPRQQCSHPFRAAQTRKTWSASRHRWCACRVRRRTSGAAPTRQQAAPQACQSTQGARHASWSLLRTMGLTRLCTSCPQRTSRHWACSRSVHT